MEETDAQVPNEPTLKRKRGRPRKSEPLEQQPAEKRARGRPRKSDISHDVAASVEPSETPATTSETTTPQTYHRPLTSTSDRDSVGVPTTVEKRPRGRPRKYKTKEEYQEAGKQYRRAHKARKSMLAAGTIRLPPAVNGADDDETDGDSVLDDDDVIADLPKTSRSPTKPTKSLATGVDETFEEYESAHEEQPSNRTLAYRHEALKLLHDDLKADFDSLRRTTASSIIEMKELKKRISEQDEQMATLRGEFASLKDYNIAIIRQREAS